MTMADDEDCRRRRGCNPASLLRLMSLSSIDPLSPRLFFQLPAAFGRLSRLNLLRLSNNALRSISVVASLTSLADLFINDNHIQHLPTLPTSIKVSHAVILACSVYLSVPVCLSISLYLSVFVSLLLSSLLHNSLIIPFPPPFRPPIPQLEIEREW